MQDLCDHRRVTRERSRLDIQDMPESQRAARSFIAKAVWAKAFPGGADLRGFLIPSEPFFIWLVSNHV